MSETTQAYWGVGCGDLDSKFPIALHFNANCAGIEIDEAKHLVKLLLMTIDFVEKRNADKKPD